MTLSRRLLTILALAAMSTLLAVALLGASMLSPPSAGPFATAAAAADDRNERRINRFRGAGLRACAVAKRRAGRGSTCTKVVHRPRARKRYEVTLRRGSYRYEVDLSRTFRVLDVDRDRIGGDDSDTDDTDDSDDSDSDSD